MNKHNWLICLTKMVLEVGDVSIACTSVVKGLLGLWQAPNATLFFLTERVKPVVLPSGKLTARSTDSAAGKDAGKSKCCTVTVQIRVVYSTRKWADVQQVSDRENVSRIAA